MTDVSIYNLTTRHSKYPCNPVKYSYTAPFIVNFKRIIFMARVTVEDCVEKVENRFELVAIAAQRAKSIASGAQITINRDNDKDAVVALREIAKETVKVDDLKNQVIQNFQRPVDLEDEDFETSFGEDESENDKEVTETSSEVSEIMEEESEGKLVNDGEKPQPISFEEENIDVED